MTQLGRRVIAAFPLASVRLLARVLSHVAAEVASARRSVLAAWEGAFVRLVASVGRHMLNDVPPLRRLVSAADDGALEWTSGVTGVEYCHLAAARDRTPATRHRH